MRVREVITASRLMASGTAVAALVVLIRLLVGWLAGCSVAGQVATTEAPGSIRAITVSPIQEVGVVAHMASPSATTEAMAARASSSSDTTRDSPDG